MLLWPSVLSKTLGEINKYTSYLWQFGDRDVHVQCFKLLRDINNNIQELYFMSVLRPSLIEVVEKERMVATYVTALVIWAMASKDRVNLAQVVTNPV